MKKVTLSNPLLGEVEFEQSHAERILAFDEKFKRTTWTLFDKTLTYSNGKIIASPSPPVNSGTEEQREDK